MFDLLYVSLVEPIGTGINLALCDESWDSGCVMDASAAACKLRDDDPRDKIIFGLCSKIVICYKLPAVFDM